MNNITLDHDLFNTDIYADYCYFDLDTPYGAGEGYGIAIVDYFFGQLDDAEGFSLPIEDDLLHIHGPILTNIGNHGTQIAAIAHQVAPLADIHIVQAASADMTGQLDALYYAANLTDVHVISMSFDTYQFSFHNNDTSTDFYDAIEYAYTQGKVVVLAAGNHRLLHRMSLHTEANIAYRSHYSYEASEFCQAMNDADMDVLAPEYQPLTYERDGSYHYADAQCAQNWHHDGQSAALGGGLQADVVFKVNRHPNHSRPLKIKMSFNDWSTPAGDRIPKCVRVVNAYDPWRWQGFIWYNITPGPHSLLADKKCTIYWAQSQFLWCFQESQYTVDLPVDFFPVGESYWRVFTWAWPSPPIGSYPLITSPLVGCNTYGCTDANGDGVCDGADLDNDHICDIYDPDMIMNHSCEELYMPEGHMHFVTGNRGMLNELHQAERHPRWSVGDMASLDLPIVVGAQSAEANEATYYNSSGTYDWSAESMDSNAIYQPGQSVDITAPSDFYLEIREPGDLQYLTGTSYSAPVIAGAIAVIASRDQSSIQTAAQTLLLNNTYDLFATGKDARSGYGALQMDPSYP